MGYKYSVTETQSFRRDPAWVNRFGERIILQLPEAMGNPPPQFGDGNRIDLSLYPLDCLAAV